MTAYGNTYVSPDAWPSAVRIGEILDEAGLSRAERITRLDTLMDEITSPCQAPGCTADAAYCARHGPLQSQAKHLVNALRYGIDALPGGALKTMMQATLEKLDTALQLPSEEPPHA